MIQEISTGKYKVLCSGSVLTFEHSDEIVFKFIDDVEKIKINIHIVFKNDNEIDGFSGRSFSENDQIFIECINFRGTLGLGIVKPLEIHGDGSKKYYFRYWVSDLGDKVSRKVDYSLYMEN